MHPRTRKSSGKRSEAASELNSRLPDRKTRAFRSFLPAIFFCSPKTTPFPFILVTTCKLKSNWYRKTQSERYEPRTLPVAPRPHRQPWETLVPVPADRHAPAHRPWRSQQPGPSATKQCSQTGKKRSQTRHSRPTSRLPSNRFARERTRLPPRTAQCDVASAATTSAWPRGW